MSAPEQATCRNRLLRALSPADFARLGPHLQRVTVELRQTLIVPNEPIRTLFFPESGYVSMVSESSGKVEVGMIGREGLVGALPVLLGSDTTPYPHFVQSPGEMLCITLRICVGSSSGPRPCKNCCCATSTP